MIGRNRNRNATNRLREPAPAKSTLPRETRPLGARIGAWRQQHLYGLFSSLGRLGGRPGATLLTVLVIGIALALPLLFQVVLDNARGFSAGLREAREITVFLKPAETTVAARAFAAELVRDKAVAAADVRSSEQGLAEFRDLSGFAQALDVLEHNPLPNVLVLTPLANIEAAEALPERLRADARVDMVQYDTLWRQRLTAILGFGERVMLAMVALLALGTLLVVGNTVRMDIHGRAEEIAVMQLIGAGDGFVRRPFLYAGLWYGLLGGMIAVLIVGAMALGVRGPLEDLLASYGNRFDGHGLKASAALTTIAASVVLGLAGAWIACTRHLRAGRPRD